jgi:hypothetical protein
VIKFVSDFWQVVGFLQLLRFPPPIESSEKDDSNDSSEVAATVNVTLVKNSSDSKQKRGKGRPKKYLATSNEFSTDDSVNESI